jgi:hypothetical protein
MNFISERERKRIEISKDIRALKSLLYDQSIIQNDYKMNGIPTTIVDKKIEDLLVLYKSKDIEIKQYLPDIKDLTENGILYVILTLHGVISNIPKSINIPKSTVFFKAMTSDYAAKSCDLYDTSMKSSLHYRMKSIISQNINSRKNKGTRRNNIKFMKKTMKTVLNEINTDMENGKTLKSNIKDLRYLISKGHVHYYENGGKIVEKLYQIQLNSRDDYDKIHVVNNKYSNLNLLDYIYLDVPTTLQKPYININMKDVFDLFKGIKYVFFVDQSCSSTSNEDEFIANRAQTVAEELEGTSYTNNIKNYENNSPYNTNNVYEREKEEPELDNDNDPIPPPPSLKAHQSHQSLDQDEKSRIDLYNYDVLMHKQRKKMREEESAKVTAEQLKKKKDYITLLRLVQKREAEKKGKPYFYNYNLNNTSLDKAHERAFNNTKLFNPFWNRSTKSNQNRQTKKGWFW